MVKVSINVGDSKRVTIYDEHLTAMYLIFSGLVAAGGSESTPRRWREAWQAAWRAPSAWPTRSSSCLEWPRPTGKLLGLCTFAFTDVCS